MKFLNFELSKPSFSTELIGLDFVWDLHNTADFLGLHVNPDDNTAVMRWAVDSGHSPAMYSGCNLVFRGLKQLIVSPRAEELPYSEDLCVSGISKIVPEQAERFEYRTRNQWEINDPFNLWVQFQSQRWIEIAAETVELAGTPRVEIAGSKPPSREV